jgi:RNA polymerase sigma-70 factor, ECF subfamily
VTAGSHWRRPDRAQGATAGDDAALVRELAAGGGAALALAYDRWHQRVRVLARRLLGEDATAEDVVQEVFTALPRAVRAFRGEADLEGFVLAITVRRSRGHMRAAARRRSALGRLLAFGPAPDGATWADPEREVYGRELAERLVAALEQLPQPQREAFVLCEVEGLTAGRAAQLAAVPEATVRTRVFHARRRLRELLATERAR